MPDTPTTIILAFPASLRTVRERTDALRHLRALLAPLGIQLASECPSFARGRYLRVTAMADVRLSQHGTIDMIGCLSREAFEFMVEHTAADALWLGRSLAVEPRYTATIMAALAAEGFEIEQQ